MQCSAVRCSAVQCSAAHTHAHAHTRTHAYTHTCTRARTHTTRTHTHKYGGTAEYWDKRYQLEPNPFDWYQRYGAGVENTRLREVRGGCVGARDQGLDLGMGLAHGCKAVGLRRARGRARARARAGTRDEVRGNGIRVRTHTPIHAHCLTHTQCIRTHVPLSSYVLDVGAGTSRYGGAGLRPGWA